MCQFVPRDTHDAARVVRHRYIARKGEEQGMLVPLEVFWSFYFYRSSVSFVDSSVSPRQDKYNESDFDVLVSCIHYIVPSSSGGFQVFFRPSRSPQLPRVTT